MMNVNYLPIIIIYLFITNNENFVTNSADSDSHYIAAVVEFRPSARLYSNSDSILKENVKAYKEFIYAPEALDVDIIVFPEGTLNDGLEFTYVPSEKDAIIPCSVSAENNVFADFLNELSCAARDSKKYVVINLTEKEICVNSAEDPRPCASSGLNIYNTNVVFDREGRIISRYRKVHIYVEQRNVTYQPEYGVFDTDFGVRFGHFICFDILFYTPAQELVERFNVTNVIFTNKFYSELPFLTAIQLQQGWSWGNNVNFLAAGVSQPLSGSTGSGIYAGKQGALAAVMVTGGKGERKLYKARLPKKVVGFKGVEHIKSTISKSSPKYIRLLKDPQIENFNSILLDFHNKEESLQGELCQGRLCCRYHISATSESDNTFYRFGVFDGRRTYEKEEWNNIQVCSVYACANETVSSCGLLFWNETAPYPSVSFKNISIQGVFKKSAQLLIIPSSLDSNLYPLKADAVNWLKVEKSNYYEVNYELKQTSESLITFGIYANYYDNFSSSSMFLIYATSPMWTIGIVLLNVYVWK